MYQAGLGKVILASEQKAGFAVFIFATPTEIVTLCRHKRQAADTKRIRAYVRATE